jgi:heme A synthase
VGVAGIGHLQHKGIVAVVMQMTFGALTVAFALSRNALVSYALLFFAGAALMVVFALFMTLVQTNVQDGLRGRVVSVYSLAFRGAMPLGNLAAGFAATLVPTPWVLVGDGVLLLTVGTYVLIRRNPKGVTAL